MARGRGHGRTFALTFSFALFTATHCLLGSRSSDITKPKSFSSFALCSATEFRYSAVHGGRAWGRGSTRLVQSLAVPRAAGAPLHLALKFLTFFALTFLTFLHFSYFFAFVFLSFFALKFLTFLHSSFFPFKTEGNIPWRYFCLRIKQERFMTCLYIGINKQTNNGDDSAELNVVNLSIPSCYYVAVCERKTWREDKLPSK